MMALFPERYGVNPTIQTLQILGPRMTGTFCLDVIKNQNTVPNSIDAFKTEDNSGAGLCIAKQYNTWQKARIDSEILKSNPRKFKDDYSNQHKALRGMDTGTKTEGFTGVKRLPGVFMSNASKCIYRHIYIYIKTKT